MTGGLHELRTDDGIRFAGPYVPADPRTWLPDWRSRPECLAGFSEIVRRSAMLVAFGDEVWRTERGAPSVATCPICDLVVPPGRPCTRCGPLETIGEVLDALRAGDVSGVGEVGLFDEIGVSDAA